MELVMEQAHSSAHIQANGLAGKLLGKQQVGRQMNGLDGMDR
jgi:hypothetical protein